MNTDELRTRLEAPKSMVSFLSPLPNAAIIYTFDHPPTPTLSPIPVSYPIPTDALQARSVVLPTNSATPPLNDMTRLPPLPPSPQQKVSVLTQNPDSGNTTTTGASMINASDSNDDDDAFASPIKQRKLRRFSYSNLYLVLLKCVWGTDAHRQGCGSKGKAFSAARELFIAEVPHMVLEHQSKPKQKSITDRFHLLVEMRRAAVKQNAATSGNTEEISEKDQLLDDLILEMDEYEENIRKEREDKNGAERNLVLAGGEIRNSALQRNKNSSDNAESDDKTLKKANLSRKHKDWFDEKSEINDVLIESVKRKRETEEKQVVNADVRLQFEKERMMKDDERFERSQEILEKLIRLDEQRLELDKEERRDSRRKREKMMEIMGAMLTKLK